MGVINCGCSRIPDREIHLNTTRLREIDRKFNKDPILHPGNIPPRQHQSQIQTRTSPKKHNSIPNLQIQFHHKSRHKKNIRKIPFNRQILQRQTNTKTTIRIQKQT